MEVLAGIFLAIIFGAVFGSYATLFSYRLPRGESCFGRYFGPKSRCPKCQNIIPTSDLIPLINWLIHKGKCRKCGVKIPRSHFFVEATTTTLFLLTYLNFGFCEEFILVALMSAALVVLLVCDYTHKKLPFQVLNFLLVISVSYRILIEKAIFPIFPTLLLGILVSVIFFKTIYKKFPHFFVDRSHFFDYVKLMLIASLAMKFEIYAFYLVAVNLTFLTLLLFKILHRKNSSGLGYVFLIPFIWVFCFIPKIF